jgi:hypothetical protein
VQHVMVVNVVDRDQVGFGGQANAIRSFHILTYVACALLSVSIL